MSLFQYYHVPWVRALRSRARRWGIVDILRHIANRGNIRYEDTFNNALKAVVRPDDIIWDIGANVGYYTFQFLKWTEPMGKVVAFEPLPEAFKVLEKSLADSAFGDGRYLLYQAAITDQDGDVYFTRSTPDENTVTTVAHIVDAAGGDTARMQKIAAFCVDSAVKKLKVPLPRVTKIDVEGYEEEVLIGGQSTFSHPDHRELFIEVHFTRLAERNKDDAPARIVQLLKKWNYRTEWVDASHIWASRSIR